MNRDQVTRWRRAVPYLTVAGLLAILFWGFRPVPILVDVEPIARGHFEVSLEEEGRARVVDRYEISAPIAGHARRLALEVGDPVAEGDLVATLDAPASPALDVRSIERARARVAAAEGLLAAAGEGVKAAEAEDALARSEYARLRPLGRQGMISESLVEQAEAEARRAVAELASARFRMRVADCELEAARTELAYAGRQDPEASGVLELRSPVAGFVLGRYFESARVVQPGEPILVIGDPSRLEVEVDVLSADAVRIAPGQRVWLERWGSPHPLEGRVKRVEPTAFTKISALGVEEQRVWVIVEIVSPTNDWDRLGDGYRVNARFILWEAEGVLQVPTSSLFRQDEAWAMFVMEQGRAHLREVAVGRRGGLVTELLGGADAGELAIVHPSREVRDEVRVRTPR
ncbi:MAG: HlyD family efflux transporter periplasmic adaptor subunit [Thiocapsa sp.]|nr:HlyD family efflux transporter periplasmic adaptor subunit [Thiocapsa sp.]MCG6897254.1 HlyD family efflux transporter periplasmic adaptor subunit [Thiocapsa sp.]MCG6983982.1 HlyD family efflux transporter periplasmic adaptor subunit [Thiocapsa sp.]